MKVETNKAKGFTAFDIAGDEPKFLGRSTDHDREAFRKKVYKAMLRGMVLIIGDTCRGDAHVGISALFQKRGELLYEFGPRGKRRTYRKTPLGYLVWAVHRHESVPTRETTKRR